MSLVSSEVLHLVDPHRHHVRLVQQDICGHEHRVREQARVDIVGMLGSLVLELGHPVQLAHIGKAV